MFIKASDKKDKTTGKIYRYYKLCESYRIGNSIRHRTLLALGKLDEIQSDSEKKLLADRIEYILKGSLEIFPSDVPEHIEKLAEYFSLRLQRQGFSRDATAKVAAEGSEQQTSDYQMVNLSSIAMEDVREVGIEWLCKQVVDQLGLGDFLKGLGWRDSDVETALIHIISKASFPCSEHKTAQWIQDNSSVAELFDKRPDSIDRFDLYRASKLLYRDKDAIEKHLSVKTNQLFDIEDKIILYDLTNTYFEGRKASSKIARFAKSKKKRNDAKVVALALVVNVEGFVKYSRIYQGNIADSKTLQNTLEDLSLGTSLTGRKPTVVLDAGIATKDNLNMLVAEGYRYVSVSRSKLKDYKLCDDGIQIEDKRKNPIQVRWVDNAQEADQYLYIKSQLKALKEHAMNDHFCERYEEELNNIASAIHKKGGTKTYGKVMERLGRLKERYPAANMHYQIQVTEKQGVATEVSWKRKPMSAPPGEGVYFIRTNIEQTDEKLVWDIYNTIRNIEQAFRVLKSDLALRPVFHKTDENTVSHLFLGILAYSIVNTVRHKLKQQGIKHDWQNIVRIMNTQKTGTITMDRSDGKKVHIRLCSKPSQLAQEIYKAMGYKMMPFYRKKFVFPE